MKSNSSATPIRATTAIRLVSIRSGVLHDDPLEDVGDVLAAVRGLLEKTEDLLPLDDLVGQEVALVLDLLDLLRLVPQRLVGGEHRLEQFGAVADLLRHRREVVVEPLFPRYQPECHPFLSKPQGSYQIVATLRLHP